MKIVFFFSSSVAIASAFIVPTPLANKQTSSVELVDHNEDPRATPNLPVVPMATAVFWAMTSGSALAAGPDWGIFEGKTLSLLHPAMMAGMLGLSVSTALLGFDWRRQRTIGGEISELKKSLPDLGGASSVAAAITAAESAEDMASVVRLKAAVPIEQQMKELQEERKRLAEKDSKDKHFKQGSLLAFLGTLFAIEVSRFVQAKKFACELRHRSFS
jgi:Protein of unknown function (DUF4079)